MNPQRTAAVTGAILSALLVFATPAAAEPTFEPTMQHKRLYSKHCRKCHGWGGTGQTKLGMKRRVKNYTDPVWQSEVSDDRVLKAIRDGWVDPENPGRKMPYFKDRLSEDDMKALLEVVRAFGKTPGPFPKRAAKEAAKFKGG